MADQTTASTLPPDASARLVEFARACKTAARAVSLYPSAHPAIAAALGRLAHLTGALTAAGPYRVQVTSDTLLVGGSGLARPDTGVAELADLLHRHLIGALTVNPTADAESWRTLLLLLARTPESVRQDGGIRHLWITAGGPSIEIDEIDYAEVLRERLGAAASTRQLIALALSRPDLDLDEAGMQLLLEMVETPGKLQELLAQLDRVGAEQGADRQAAAFLALVRGLAAWLSRHDPDRLDPVFRRMGQAAGRLTAGAMLALIEHRRRPDSPAGLPNAATLVIERMSDESIAQFVAGSVVRERGATERLAQAFQALAPDADRQRRLLALAEADVAEAEGGAGGLADLWQRVESMLTSYTDDAWVSAQYAHELAGARTRAVEVERASDDPPERIAVWLGSVADSALRTLDHQLLLDLLRIETDGSRWRDVAETAATHAEGLVRVGYFDYAWELVRGVVEEGERDTALTANAAAAVRRFVEATMVRHVPAHLRAADEMAFERFRALCAAIGPDAIPALAGALAAEQDARARQRIRDVVVGFGAPGRDAVRQLMNAPGWEIRRTAAALMREFGGAADVRELAPLLTDSEPLVQREAMRALVLAGTDEASRILLETIRSARVSARGTLLDEMAGVRDERAGPHFGYLVRHADRRRERDVSLRAIDALGALGGGPHAVEALRDALYHRDWRAPFGARQLRLAAARALRRVGTAAAVDVLRDAAAGGTLGIRAAARSQLAGLPGHGLGTTTR